jgi:hypothetical protein
MQQLWLVLLLLLSVARTRNEEQQAQNRAGASWQLYKDQSSDCWGTVLSW